MSTKTSIKRIALVAVSALGFGFITSIAANAAPVGTWDVTIAASKVNAISLAGATGNTNAVNTAIYVNVGMDLTTTTVTSGDHGQTIPLKAYLSTYPSSGFAQVTAATVQTGTTATQLTGAIVDATTTPTLTIKQETQGTAIGTSAVTASSTVGMGTFKFTPTVAGTYVLTVWHDPSGSGVVDIGEAVQTISITVAGQAAFSQTLSTSILDDANSFDATLDEEVRVSKAVGVNGASIEVTLLDVNGNPYYGARVQADVSGPGYVDVEVGADDSYNDATARTDYLDLASNANTADINVTADGTSGTSTITITIKDPVTLATLGTFTEKMYFYGTVASLTATKNFNIARANATERGCASATTCDQLDFDSTPFVSIVAKDAEGNLVPGLTVTAKITDLSVIAASTVGTVTAKASATTAGVSTDVLGLGYYNASVAGNIAATSGSKTTVVYRTLLADGVTYVTSNAVEISIGGSAANTTLTFDKASYEPGEGMTITRTAKDASGNPVYDGYAAGAVTFSKAVSGSVGADIYLDGVVTSDNSRGAKTVFAPVAGGAFTATMTGKTAAVTADIVATATVGSTESQAAVDAANEATDAANAATDAANAAAEAADAATAAAQDAQAAVAALATQVSTLIAGIKAQITTLTNLVIKIQKKVRA